MTLKNLTLSIQIASEPGKSTRTDTWRFNFFFKQLPSSHSCHVSVFPLRNGSLWKNHVKCNGNPIFSRRKGLNLQFVALITTWLRVQSSLYDNSLSIPLLCETLYCRPTAETGPTCRHSQSHICPPSKTFLGRILKSRCLKVPPGWTVVDPLAQCPDCRRCLSSQIRPSANHLAWGCKVTIITLISKRLKIPCAWL